MTFEVWNSEVVISEIIIYFVTIYFVSASALILNPNFS